MKVYTIDDLEKFERDDFGRLVCPTGDYTQIKVFGEYCIFGEGCRFGEHCIFGEYCVFGECCRFGEWCSFGGCCGFGEYCSFGGRCIFGEWCSFGECCGFGEYCRFENIAEVIDRVIKIDRIGSRNGCTYFFKTLSEIYVRCGCFFGTLEEFEEQVNETHKDNEQYRKEYLEAIRYIKAIM